MMMTQKSLGGWEFWLHKGNTQTFEAIDVPKAMQPNANSNARFMLANGTPCWAYFDDTDTIGGACLEPATSTWMPINKPLSHGGWDEFTAASMPGGAALIGGVADSWANGPIFIVNDGFYLAMPKGGFQ